MNNLFAVSIGISRYKKFSNLMFSSNDAIKFSEKLTSPSGCGYERGSVRLLTDEDATRDQIQKVFSDWLPSNTHSKATLLILWSGHGVKIKNKHYLIPFDSDISDEKSMISADEFVSWLETIKVEKLVVFLDTCHSGGLGHQKSGDNAIVDTALEKGDIYTPTAKIAHAISGRVILTSCKPEQYSYENRKLNHGIYTYHLLEALDGKGAIVLDGSLRIMDVAIYLWDTVKQTATEFNLIQEPLFNASNLDDNFVVGYKKEYGHQRELKQKNSSLLMQVATSPWPIGICDEIVYKLKARDKNDDVIKVASIKNDLVTIKDEIDNFGSTKDLEHQKRLSIYRLLRLLADLD